MQAATYTGLQAALADQTPLPSTRPRARWQLQRCRLCGGPFRGYRHYRYCPSCRRNQWRKP
jgi:rubrerythrin